MIETPFRAAAAWIQTRPFPAALALVIAAWGVYVWCSRPWFALGDQAWVLEVARHVAAGDGVKTSLTFPAYLAASPGAAIDRNPFVIYPPGYPLLLGAVVKMAGPAETSALLLHGIFFVALLVLTYVVARRFLDPLASALVVVLLGLQPKLLWLTAVQYTPDLPFAVVLLAATALIVHVPAARSVFALAAAGGLAATAQMFRFNGATLVPAFAALIAAESGRARAIPRVATFVGTWAICLIVLLWSSQAGATSVTFAAGLLLIDTPGYPGLSVEGDPNMPSLAVVLQQHLGGVLRKAVAGLRFYVDQFASIGHPLLTGGVVLAGILLVGVRPARTFLLFVGTSIAITIGVVSFIAFDTRYFLFLLPSFVILVVWALRAFAPDLRIAGTVLVTLALVVYVGEAARLARDGQDRATLATELSALASYLRETSRPGDWIASDLYHVIPWRAGIPAIRLPNQVRDLADIARLRQPVTRLVLSDLGLTPERRSFTDETWVRVLHGEPLAGFELERSFSGERLHAVVLRAKQ